MSRAHWLTAAVALCVVSGVAAVAYAAGRATSEVPEVIRAQRFELVDARGRTRGSLGLPGLRLRGPQGKGGILLGVQGDGTPVFGVSDSEGRPRFSLEARTDGSVNLALYAGDPHVRAIFKLDSEGQPSIQLLDRDNVPRAVLGASVIGNVRAGARGKTPESSLVLLDADGRVIWRVP